MILLPALDVKTSSSHQTIRTRFKPLKTMTKSDKVQNKNVNNDLEPRTRQHHHSHNNSGAESDISDTSSSSNNTKSKSQIPNIHLPPINIDRASLIGSDIDDQLPPIMLDTNMDNIA